MKLALIAMALSPAIIMNAKGLDLLQLSNMQKVCSEIQLSKSGAIVAKSSLRIDTRNFVMHSEVKLGLSGSMSMIDAVARAKRAIGDSEVLRSAIDANDPVSVSKVLLSDGTCVWCVFYVIKVKQPLAGAGTIPLICIPVFEDGSISIKMQGV